MRFGRVKWWGDDAMTDDLVVAAASAPTVVKLRGLVEWVGAGRALTQTGRLRRADAIALVKQLHTGDVLDPRYPLQSSAELHRLTLLLELARACGLLRVVRRRLVPVSKRVELLERPVVLVERLLRVLPRLGHELGHSVVVADAANAVEAVFADLAGCGGRLPIERACDVAWRAAMERFMFTDATDQQIEFERRRADGDARRILEVAGGLGVVTVAGDVVAATPLGARSIGAFLGLGTPESDALTVRATLVGSADPVVWRRLRVPGDIRLDRFHQVLAAAMGWQDSHLHVFERGSNRYGFPDPDLGIRSDRGLALVELLARPGDELDHEYDFGDGWRHEITVEAVEQGRNDGVSCIDGAGRCPPEDVGGIPGYEDLRRTLADPDDERHTEMLEWLGLENAEEFDADAFSVEAADDAITGALIARAR
jgi:hypothetical protein